MDDDTRRVIDDVAPGALQALTEAGLQLFGADPLSSAVGGIVVGTALVLDKVGFLHRLGRGQAAVDAAAAELGGEDELLRLAISDRARLELAMQVIEAAARTTYEEKVRALGRVLAQGLGGDKVDESRFLVAALTDLEAPHVQLLARVSSDLDKPIAKAPNTGAIGWSREQMMEALPGHALLIDPMLRSLELHGLVRDIAPPGGGYGGGEARYLLTDLGAECLRLLASDGGDRSNVSS